MVCLLQMNSTLSGVTGVTVELKDPPVLATYHACLLALFTYDRSTPRSINNHPRHDSSPCL